MNEYCLKFKESHVTKMKGNNDFAVSFSEFQICHIIFEIALMITVLLLLWHSKVFANQKLKEPWKPLLGFGNSQVNNTNCLDTYIAWSKKKETEKKHDSTCAPVQFVVIFFYHQTGISNA